MAAEPEDHDDRSVVLFAATHLKELPQAVDRIHQAIVDLTPSAGAPDPSPEATGPQSADPRPPPPCPRRLRLERSDFAGARNQVEVALALSLTG